MRADRLVSLALLLQARGRVSAPDLAAEARGVSGHEAEALLVLGVPAAVAELGLADALAAAQRKIRVTAGASGSVGAFRASGARGGAGGAGGGAVPALVHLDPARWVGRGGGAGPRPRPSRPAALVRRGRAGAVAADAGDRGPRPTAAADRLPARRS